uniref:Uncharacterized protein n=1 Tax=Anguilla anguilla TaxID=7936 RepID=A0A0E9SX35_ANGAN
MCSRLVICHSISRTISYIFAELR